MTAISFMASKDRTNPKERAVLTPPASMSFFWFSLLIAGRARAPRLLHPRNQLTIWSRRAEALLSPDRHPCVQLILFLHLSAINTTPTGYVWETLPFHSFLISAYQVIIDNCHSLNQSFSSPSVHCYPVGAPFFRRRFLIATPSSKLYLLPRTSPIRPKTNRNSMALALPIAIHL